jgi:hypothetical protein
MKVNMTIGIPRWVDRIFAWPVMIYRKWKYGYSYRRIYLGEGEWTIVDEKDYYQYGNYKWSGCSHDGHIYAARLLREMKCGRIKSVFLHREIMNAPKGLLVDHENRGGLDNRRSNLRLATHSQNCCNRPKKANTSSRFIGVCFIKARRRWLVTTKDHGKCIFIGYFDDETEAAKAYDAAAKKYHGEFACLNFPKDTD